MAFLHGVEILEVDEGSRPITTVRSSTIGIVGTAPNADATKFPLNTPVLIAGSRAEAAGLDTVGAGLGTLPNALDGILDQAGALVVVVRVEEGADEVSTLTNMIGGTATDGSYAGIYALLAAESMLGFQPRILVAPGFSSEAGLMSEMAIIAERLRAIAVIDGANTTDVDVIEQAGNSGSDRLYLVDPYVQVFRSGASVYEPASPRVAGVIARIDNERGFWNSPSNTEILGITGTQRPIDFKLGDSSSRANLLNENNVSTIIRQDGYRLWGNRTLSSDPKWQFISVRRTADLIEDSIQRAHMWAVDRSITRNYVQSVVENVNRYIRDLVNLGALINGVCYADPERNTPSAIQSGQVFFEFEFTPGAYPAERITFNSFLTDAYLSEIFA